MGRSRRTRTVVIALAAVTLAGGAVALATCGGIDLAGPSPATSKPGAAAECATRLTGPDPELGVPPPLQPPASRLSVGLEIGTKRLLSELDRHVPKGLGAAHRKPIGTPGEVSYTVSRGAFAIALISDRLVVTTPISVSVTVCKPLGPICPQYGSCNPQLTTTASVPLLLGADYRVGKSAASYSINQGCTIAGMDVSSKIRAIAQRRIGEVQRRVDAAIVDGKPIAERAWKAATASIAIAGSCLRIRPSKLLQTPPRLEGDRLSLRITASGRVDVTATCVGDSETGSLPPLEVAAKSEPTDTGSVVAAAVSLAIEQLNEALQLTATKGSLRNTTVTAATAHPAAYEGKAVLALSVTLAGAACGTAWLRATPRYDPTTRTVKLGQVAPWPNTTPPPAALAGAIERSVAIALPVSAPAIAAKLDGLEAALRTAISEGLADELKGQSAAPTVIVVADPARIDVAVVAEGLRLVVRRSGDIRVRL